MVFELVHRFCFCVRRGIKGSMKDENDQDRGSHVWESCCSSSSKTVAFCAFDYCLDHSWPSYSIHSQSDCTLSSIAAAKQKKRSKELDEEESGHSKRRPKN